MKPSRSHQHGDGQPTWNYPETNVFATSIVVITLTSRIRLFHHFPLFLQGCNKFVVQVPYNLIHNGALSLPEKLCNVLLLKGFVFELEVDVSHPNERAVWYGGTLYMTGTVP